MASIRKTKKEVAYLTGEVISNSYLAIYFQSEDKRDQLIDIINKAAVMHNDLIDRINKPDSKDNLRKYYRALREEMFAQVDQLFGEISDVCKSEKTAKPVKAAK